MGLNARDIAPSAVRYALFVAGCLFGCWLLPASASVSTSSGVHALIRRPGPRIVVPPIACGGRAVDDNARWLGPLEKGEMNPIHTVQAKHRRSEGQYLLDSQGQETG